MDEKFLHYIWQHGLFDSNEMYSIDGRKISLRSRGTYNQHEGPDFSAAQLEIDHVLWTGNIEIHVRSSDWLKHKHQHHPQYQNIILHVVWEHDLDLPDTNFPTLQLKGRVPEDKATQYQTWRDTPDAVPCAALRDQVPDLVWSDWKDSLLVERLLHKAEDWQKLFEQLGHDWRMLLYVKLAENFGFRINAVPMRMLAISLPLHILEKINEDITLLEALFIGQAGLLSEQYQEDYPKKLWKHYQYLSQRFGLHPLNVPWKYLRMRPANFPTLRLAQFAALMRHFAIVFRKTITAADVHILCETLDIAPANLYWERNYHFNQKTEHRATKKTLGRKSIENIAINTLLPFRYYYGRVMGDDALQEQSLDMMQQLAPEVNKVTKLSPATQIRSAADTQAFIQLFNEYCSRKKCLDCRIGAYLLKK